MTIYLLKVVLCSALFLGCYFLLFQREKTYRFNRFYLLFSLFASFIIPFIEIENGSTPINIPQVETVFIPTQEVQPITLEKEIFITPKQTSKINILLLIYALVSTTLLIIFLINIFVLFKEIRNNKKVILGEISIVLLDKKITPYSFMKYVFVNREDYEKQNIEKEIFLHESTHVKQGHSYDILVIEFLILFLWVNPLLFFYKKAIQLNHEFLADEAVINTYESVTNYQYLLIEKASQPNHFLFTSSFNYSITKQRLKMMTKSTSKTKALLITLAFVPLFACAIFMFSTKIYAQKSVAGNKEKGVISMNKETSDAYKGASNQMIAEYYAIVKRHFKEVPNSKSEDLILENINKSETDKERIRVIYNTMTKKQQYAQNVRVQRRSDYISQGIAPTEKEFENFKDPKKFGIWIDDKKVKNSELNKYKASDFGDFDVSNLYGVAKLDRNGKKLIYKYQLGMMTNSYYEKYRKEALADTKQRYVIRDLKKLKADLASF
jgi:bla regulator protein blaR1